MPRKPSSLLILQPNSIVKPRIHRIHIVTPHILVEALYMLVEVLHIRVKAHHVNADMEVPRAQLHDQVQDVHRDEVRNTSLETAATIGNGGAMIEIGTGTTVVTRYDDGTVNLATTVVTPVDLLFQTSDERDMYYAERQMQNSIHEYVNSY